VLFPQPGVDRPKPGTSTSHEKENTMKFYEATIGQSTFEAASLTQMSTKLTNYYAMDSEAPQADAIKVFEHDDTAMLSDAAVVAFNMALRNEWLDMVDNARATEAVERGQMGVR